MRLKNKKAVVLKHQGTADEESSAQKFNQGV